jgi:hypothetical protein
LCFFFSEGWGFFYSFNEMRTRRPPTRVIAFAFLGGGGRGGGESPPLPSVRLFFFRFRFRRCHCRINTQHHSTVGWSWQARHRRRRCRWRAACASSSTGGSRCWAACHFLRGTIREEDRRFGRQPAVWGLVERTGFFFFVFGRRVGSISAASNFVGGARAVDTARADPFAVGLKASPQPGDSSPINARYLPTPLACFVWLRLASSGFVWLRLASSAAPCGCAIDGGGGR